MLYTPSPDRGSIIRSLYDGSTTTAGLSDLFEEMENSPLSPGRSDIGIRNFLAVLAINLKPRRVLEIGTHIGFGSLIIGNQLRANAYGKLLTLEPNPRFRAAATDYIERAGLRDFIEILPQFSYEEQCRARLKSEAPFELIFIDGAHDYASALADISLCSSLILDNGIILLHDTGRHSPSMDKTGNGGVRKALYDFVRDQPAYKAQFFEHPLYPHPCGAAMLCRQVYDPPIRG